MKLNKPKRRIISAGFSAMSTLILLVAVVIFVGYTLAWFPGSDIDFEQDIMGFWYEINLDEHGGEEFSQAHSINIDDIFPMGDPKFDDFCVSYYEEQIYRFRIRNSGTIGVHYNFSVMVDDSHEEGLSDWLRFSIRAKRNNPLNNTTHTTDWLDFEDMEDSYIVISRGGGLERDNLLQRELNRLIALPSITGDLRTGAGPNINLPHYDSSQSNHGFLPSTLMTFNPAVDRHWVIFEIFIWLCQTTRLENATYLDENNIRQGKSSTITLILHAVQDVY